MTDYTELIADLRDGDQANWKRLSLDAAAAIESLQADVEELKRVNMELFDDLPKYGEKILHWVSVFDDLPRHNAVVVVSDGKRSWDVGQYHCLFEADDRTIWWWKKATTRKVLWWMYKEDALPEPPQEES